VTYAADALSLSDTEIFITITTVGDKYVHSTSAHIWPCSALTGRVVEIYKLKAVSEYIYIIQLKM